MVMEWKQRTRPYVFGYFLRQKVTELKDMERWLVKKGILSLLNFWKVYKLIYNFLCRPSGTRR
jgi:hypothetical protein